MIRQFWLTNENGEEWDLKARSTSMFSAPKGMAEGVGNRTYWQGKRTFVQTNYRDAQSTITGVINFTSGRILSDFERYIHQAEELYLHVIRNDVPERYCRVDCVLTERPEDFAGWVLANVTFKRLSAWRSPARTETLTLSAASTASFALPADGSLPSAFRLSLYFTGPFDAIVTVSDSDGDCQIKFPVDASPDETLILSTAEGEQSITFESDDIYDQIDFSVSTFFELKPGKSLNIAFTGDTFTGTATLEIIDQWNEA